MENRNWYENAFIYQIYPRSFADGNRDGIGDIPGIISKLDYLANLGVDGIWISPFFESPLDDCGYDISDYRKIAPEYGTLRDFDLLLSEAHDRGIKVLLDLVVNHVSVKHEWFQKAIENPGSKYHDYFFWRKKGEFTESDSPDGGGGSDSVWMYVPETDEYYLHLAYPTQADLNWDNPEVREEIYDMINYWLDRGVDGFRCDIIYLISKEPTLTEFGVGPHLHEYLHEMNERCFKPHGAITVAEVWGQTPESTLEMIAKERGELTMSFYFDHLGLGRQGRFGMRPFNPEEFVSILARWQDGINGKAQNTLVLENHDQSRVVSRFGDAGFYKKESAKMLAGITFLMQGTSFIYEGQELGLVNPTFTSLDQIKDVETLAYIEEQRKAGRADADILSAVNFGTRDAGRVPMPWTDGEHFGFTEGTPWIDATLPYSETNAEAEEKDEDSVLNFYKKLIALKKSSPVLSYGTFKLLNNERGFFRYEREYGGKKMTVAGNFSDEGKETDTLAKFKNKKPVLSVYPEFEPDEDGGVLLRPYELLVFSDN